MPINSSIKLNERVFLTEESHYEHLIKLAEAGPISVTAVSYRIYAGILFDGYNITHKYPNLPNKFLNALSNVPKVRVLVGIPKYFTPKKVGKCEYCISDYCKQFVKYTSHRDHWNNYEWRYSVNCHMKCFIFNYEDGEIVIGGGRNMTGSGWGDATFELTKKQGKTMVTAVNLMWDRAIPLLEDNLSGELEKQGVYLEEII